MQFTCDGCVGTTDLSYKHCLPDSSYCNCSLHNLTGVIRLIYCKIQNTTKEIIGFEETYKKYKILSIFLMAGLAKLRKLFLKMHGKSDGSY